jgi:ankyrin repeat protein
VLTLCIDAYIHDLASFRPRARSALPPPVAATWRHRPGPTPDPITAVLIGSRQGVLLLLARKGVEVNKSAADGATALMVASQYGHVEVVRLLLARQDVEVNETGQNGVTALMLASHIGQLEVVRLLLAHPDVKANRTSTDSRSALCLASQSGQSATVSLLVAHRAHGQVRLLAADAIDSLPADLYKELPRVAAQAAALRLPLDVAAALGDTEEERAAADRPRSRRLTCS